MFVCVCGVCVCVCVCVWKHLPQPFEFSWFTLDAGLLAISQYSEGPATGHLGTQVFLGFPVSKSKC